CMFPAIGHDHRPERHRHPMEKRLTEAVIPTLRTSRVQEEVYHSATPSAGIRITREGAKTFFIRYRSPTFTGQSSGRPVLRRYYCGEHRCGRPGEGRYLNLKEFESAYAVFRGQLAQGIDPQPPAARGKRQRLVAASGTECAPLVVSADQVPEALRRLFPRGYTAGTVSALLADYFEHHGPHLPPRT